MAVDGEGADTTMVGVSDARCRGGSVTGVAVDTEAVVLVPTFATVIFIDSALITTDGSVVGIVSSR